ncbi:MAG: hypothetical protein HY293_02235 [Planctomycetes bacterium]|nr:hypothetical protein [Planctomycetota bacterium]
MAWTREDLAALPSDTEALAVKFKEPEDADLRLIAGLKSLESLQIDYPGRITDEGFRLLATLPRLKTLSCSVGGATPEGLSALAGCPGLVELDLSARDENMTDAAMGALGRLTTLEKLHVSGCGQATDAGVAALTGLTRLKSLGLSWSDRITGKTFDALASAPGLAKLDITGIGLSKEGAASLARLPALRHLKLYNGGFGDEQLRSLAGCRKLEDLSIHRDQRDSIAPTDAGVAALAPLRNLRLFSITGSAVSGEAVRRLAASMPALCLVR